MSAANTVHPAQRLHGVMGEFSSAEALVRAAEAARRRSYSRMDAYTPYPIEGLAEALGARSMALPWLVLAGGIVGGTVGYAMQYFAAVIDYPMNVGGRPLNSWPSFMPVAFELTILCAALAAVLGMLGMNRLPRPHHPVFNAPRFALASRDRFFLCLEGTDPMFDRETALRDMRAFGAEDVVEVTEL